MVVQADSTLAMIRKDVRRLTASSSESALSTNDIDQYINTSYNQDFPYAVKLDQMRSVYTFYTAPNIDRYSLDVNYNQGVRAPFYVDGIQGSFYKDRDQFYKVWTRFPTISQPITGDGVTQSFSFTIGSIPFLRKEVTLGGVDVSGSPIRVSDDGSGNLYVQTPNPVVSVPAYTSTSPGMYNLNTSNPGQNLHTYVGTVNYVTGAFSINFALAGLTPISGQQMTLFVAQYQTSRPYSLLFWNNEFIIRPVPQLVHKCEIEVYMTPVQFLNTTDVPILNQWWQLISIMASKKILQRRQDMEGVSYMDSLYKEQMGLVLERQGIEEIGQANVTIYNGATQVGNYAGFTQGWG